MEKLDGGNNSLTTQTLIETEPFHLMSSKSTFLLFLILFLLFLNLVEFEQHNPFVLCSFLHPEDSDNEEIKKWLLTEKLEYIFHMI